MSEVVCPLCGDRFDPEDHRACGSCPLHGGCGNICCPACGHSTIDPSSSAAVAAARGLARWLRRRPAVAPSARSLTLLDVPPGRRAEVVDLDGLPARRRERLHAYGLVPGGRVHVLRRSHVTVIEVEHLELAFEDELAGAVRVRELS